LKGFLRQKPALRAWKTACPDRPESRPEVCKISKNKALPCPAIAAFATADARNTTHYHVLTRMQVGKFIFFAPTPFFRQT
jgi:hypothetical protein